MCRWFTYLGVDPQLLEDIVIRPRHGIFKQIDEHFLPQGHTSFNPSRPTLQNANADDRDLKAAQLLIMPASANDTGSPNPLTNMDGFGLGWWTSTNCEFELNMSPSDPKALRPVVYKNVRPPLNDLVLRNLASGTSSKAVLAHIRAGTGLTPVVETNCHPFVFGRHLFAHNGVLGSFHLFRNDVLQYLPLRYQVSVLGTTDAEHMAAVYFYHLCGTDGDWSQLYPVEEMGDAMRKTVAWLETQKAKAEGLQGIEPQYTSLNLVAASGSSLVALRYASPIGREPPSLYYSTTAGPTMNRKYEGSPDDMQPCQGDHADHLLDKDQHGKHVIVASEPSTFNAEEWELVGPGQMVLVDEGMNLGLQNI